MNIDLNEIIRFSIENSINTFEQMKADPGFAEIVYQISTQISLALENGKKILIFGNGGSAADAQHIAAEFVGRYLKDRKALPAIALTTNTSILTAIGNDYSFDDIFARQVEAFGSNGDIAVGISTSGKSSNVIKGLEKAKTMGLLTVGLTGKNGGRIKGIVDYCICSPSDETPRIQEGHILVGHILAAIVEEEIFGSQ